MWGAAKLLVLVVGSVLVAGGGPPGSPPALVAGGGTSRPPPAWVPVGTADGGIVRGSVVTYAYPSGTLSDVFVPPAWTERAGGPCPAQLALSPPEMGKPLTARAHTATIPFVPSGSPPRRLRMRWAARRVTLARAPAERFEVAIDTPSEWGVAGQAIRIEIVADARKRDSQARCPVRRAESAGMARAHAAALSVIRHLALRG